MRRLPRVLLVLLIGLALVSGLPGPAPALAQPSLLPGHYTPASTVPHDAAPAEQSGRPLRGCGSSQPSVAALAIAELPRVHVSIYDGYFLPAEINVPRGSVVVWTNHGRNPHTTTAWDRWDSGVLRPGQSCAAWLLTPGTYEYLSIAAADGGTMTGVVNVDTIPVGTRPTAEAAGEGR
jgi:plastocyanin